MPRRSVRVSALLTIGKTSLGPDTWLVWARLRQLGAQSGRFCEVAVARRCLIVMQAVYDTSAENRITC